MNATIALLSWGYHAILVITVIHWHCSWVGLLAAFLPWKFTCHLLICWKLVLSGGWVLEGWLPGHIQLSSLGLLCKMHGVSSNRDLPSTVGRQPRATAVDYIVLRVFCFPLTKHSKGVTRATAVFCFCFW